MATGTAILARVETVKIGRLVTWLASTVPGRTLSEAGGLRVAVPHAHGRQGPEREHASLPGTGLGLHDDVPTLEDREHRTLLDRRRPLEAVRVDPLDDVVRQAEAIEGGNHLNATQP